MLHNGRVHPDANLAAGLARDPAAGFEALVNAYQDRIFRFAVRFIGNAADGEEIAQDTFLRAHRALQSYDRARIKALAVGPWLYTIALNTARNRVRGKRLPLAALDESAARIPQRDPAHAPEAALLAASGVAELQAVLAALPQRYRSAVILKHIEELPYAEIAVILRQPEGTVKANVHRGLALVRERLAPPLGERIPS